MWGVLAPAFGGSVCPAGNCNHYPILGFTNADPVSPLTTGGTGRYRVFDSTIGFTDLATPVTYDQWTDVCIAWTGADVRHYINGVQVYVQSDMTQGDASFGPPNKYINHIVQAYNFGGADWNVNWSGLGSGQVSSSSVAVGSPQTVAQSTAFAVPLTLAVLDATGAPLPCVPVTFAVPGVGASAVLSSLSAVTDRNGRASVTASANATLGSYNVTAQAAGGIAAVTFLLNNGPAAPSVNPTGVPTLTSVGLGLLVLMLAGTAMLGSRRR